MAPAQIANDESPAACMPTWDIFYDVRQVNCIMYMYIQNGMIARVTCLY